MRTLLTFLLLLTSFNIFAQDGGNFSSTPFNAAAEQLFSLQNDAKVNGSVDQINALQQQIDSKIGTVTKTPQVQDGENIIVNSLLNNNTDNININTLITGTGVKGLATYTEARGSNIGRIWTAVGYAGTGTNGDTIAFFRSDDGGIHFTLVFKASFIANVKLKNDQLDMEVVENSTGDKVIWLVRGMTNTSSNSEYVGGTIFNTTTLANASPVISWPGDNASTFLYGPRITSDNEQYASNPYVFIVASCDSLVSGSHNLKVKYAQCNDPFNVNGAITFNPSSVAGNNSRPYLPHFTVDIAFYRNAGDSLVIINNNRVDSTSISVRSFKRLDALNASIPLSFDLQPASTNQTMFPKLAASGLSTVVLAYRTNHQNNGDWDIRSYVCKSGISVQGSWVSRTIDNTTDAVNPPFTPDIIGVKLGTGSFKVSYVISSVTGMLKYSSLSAGSSSWQSPVTILPSGASAGTVPPVAGYRLVSGDSAYLSYSGFNGVNAYGVAGSSGAVIGIDPVSNNTPDKFELSQNFPNPFNPETSINFAIPEKTFATLQVYDISGRVVAVLVNEDLSAGTYSMKFNGSEISSGVYFYRLTTSSFTETKKMLLVK